MNKALNSPFKGYYPNVNPFGISPRYDTTSLYQLYNKYKEDEVNSSIKPVDDRKEANAEIEKGEIVRQELENGGILLHKAVGKKHSKGGIPVNLPDNSFIFSNFKTTSLNKEELDTFKLGGFNKNVNNRTPSKILEKNVNIKHYNEMEKYLQESKDPVQLKTAQLMKLKYDETVSKIAALQESKKEQTQIPDFASLPMDSPELQQKEIMTEMYQEGGHVLPQYQNGSFYNPKVSTTIKGGNKIGEINLQDYFSKPIGQQMLLAKEYGISPTDMDKYRNSAVGKIYISPGGAIVQPEVNTTVNSSKEKTVLPATDKLTTEEGDKFDWVKPYNNNPNILSMIGNMAQYPKAYSPGLSLEQPVRLREQQINAQQGVNDILANRYMSMKASNQYLPNSVANSQFLDTDVNKQIVDYRNQVNQANQNVSTDIHNKNALDQNRVVNSNNDRRSQYQDKMNELYQNIANERNTINSTNLNILGKGIQEKESYSNNIDLLKKSYDWNVRNNMSQNNSLESLQKQIEDINKNPNLDNNMKSIWLMQLAKKYYQSNPAVNPYN